MGSSEFFAALLGGGISAATAAGFFMWEKSWADKLRKKELGMQRSAIVLSVVAKLSVFLETQLGIKKHIDECFVEAEGMDLINTEPADIFLELVLLPLTIDPISSEEMALCLLSGDRGLLEKILTSQSSYLANYHVMVKLNEYLSNYKAFKIENALVQSTLEGNVGRLLMPEQSRPKRDAMVAEINSLIGPLIGANQSDIRFTKVTIRRFLSAVGSISGVDVPKVTFVGERDN